TTAILWPPRTTPWRQASQRMLRDSSANPWLSLRHSLRFHLRKLKSRGYFKTRVQLDDARQRERGKQRAGRNRSLQDSRRRRAQRATISFAPGALRRDARTTRWSPAYARTRRPRVRP